MSKQPSQMFFGAVEARRSDSANFERATGAVINSWFLANSEAEAETRVIREVTEKMAGRPRRTSR